MSEREELIQRLKRLIEANKVKQATYRQQYNVSDEIGFLTREAVIMASLLPKMQQLGVTFDDCK